MKNSISVVGPQTETLPRHACCAACSSNTVLIIFILLVTSNSSHANDFLCTDYDSDQFSSWNTSGGVGTGAVNILSNTTSRPALGPTVTPSKGVKATQA